LVIIERDHHSSISSFSSQISPEKVALRASASRLDALS